MWQTGFQCPRIDCPLQTLRAKPTHERKKYIAVFFPRKRRYNWTDLHLILPISEYPQPLASGTHRKWRKLVEDLTMPCRYIMQKLAVAILNITDQLHTEVCILFTSYFKITIFMYSCSNLHFNVVGYC